MCNLQGWILSAGKTADRSTAASTSHAIVISLLELSFIKIHKVGLRAAIIRARPVIRSATGEISGTIT